MRHHTFALAGTLTLSLLAAPATAFGPPLDLTGWSLFDPDGDWIFSNPTTTTIRIDEAKGSSVVHPGWVVSDFILAPTCSMEFDLQVAAGTSDDDFIGFGFSFYNGSNSYLLDWKRGAQSFNWGQPVAINDDFAEAGMKIKRINGSYTWDGLWGGTDGLGVSTIAGPVAGAWVAGTVYHFNIDLAPGSINVWRDGVQIFNVTNSTYAGGGGAIALYGFSQDNIILSNVCITPPPTTCPADLNQDGVVDGADLGILLGAWGLASSPADLNGDGTVDGADLGGLLGAWGPCA